MRILNSDSRKRSTVGRMAFDFGAMMARPRSAPPTTRITFLADDVVADRRRGPAIGAGHADWLCAFPVCSVGPAPTGHSVQRARDALFDRRGRLSAALRPSAPPVAPHRAGRRE